MWRITEATVAEAVVASLEREGRFVLRVFGTSMSPVIWPGARVPLVRCSAADVAVGDVVLTRASDGSLTLHRVRSIDERTLETQGDGRRTRDGRVPCADVLAKVDGLVLGRWSFPRVPAAFARPIGLRLARWAPRARRAVRLIAPWVPRWSKRHRSARASIVIEPAAARHALELRRYLLRRGIAPNDLERDRWRSAVESERGAAWLAVADGRVVGALRLEHGVTQDRVVEAHAERGAARPKLALELVERAHAHATARRRALAFSGPRIAPEARAALRNVGAIELAERGGPAR